MTATAHSITCKCEMCQWAGSIEVKQDSVSPFDYEWDSAPRALTNYVERSIAEYWFLRGVRAGREEALQAQTEDLRELVRVARVAREGLGR